MKACGCGVLVAALGACASSARWQDLAPLAFVCTDPAAWRQTSASLELLGPSQYEPPVRSPKSLAIGPELPMADFVFEVEVRSTAAEYPHRDLVLVFGYQDPSHFYYAHLASSCDAHAHGLFVVDGAPRVKLADSALSAGVAWGEGWHRLRLERRGSDGAIGVWFDDVKVLAGSDSRYGPGRLGVGSFDDSGGFRALRWRAWAAHRP